jgi:glycosyltransferase involved in cell wall biosynthesis
LSKIYTAACAKNGFEAAMKIVMLGTYDTGKPRIRILRQGLKLAGAEVIECHRDVWGGTEDKSQVRGIKRKIALAGKWILAYPSLIWSYLRLPRHDAVLIGYLGLLDVLLLWPIVRLRRVPIVWDIFVPLYSTVVEDRSIVGKYNPVAWAIYALEYLAIRLVNVVVIDTQAHAGYIRDTYHRSPEKVQTVLVGAEPEFFDTKNESAPIIENNKPFRVLFYGQFIPLHGIEFVVQAAKLCEAEDTEWLIIGKGQEADRIGKLIEGLCLANLKWIEWVQYEDLVGFMTTADVVLGIFGTTGKAGRVIPNKVYQILMAGRPLITADTPAIRELLSPGETVRLVPPGNAEALAKAVLNLRDNYPEQVPGGFHSALSSRIQPADIGRELLQIMRSVVPESRSSVKRE